MPTQRYKLTIAYRGTAYHGWQRQTLPPTWKGPVADDGAGLPTVQETLERAIGSVVGHPARTLGSSRTDAGVHAKGQVAHFDTERTQIPPEGLRRAVNSRLPGDILVRTIEPVGDNFDAVSSTLSKRYQYFIWHTDDRPVFAADLAWHRWQPLDLKNIQAAAKIFVGTHDFASFARPGHGRESTIRTVLTCEVHERAGRLVIGIEGSGFLWNQIRIMVGTLVEVGLGRKSADSIAEILAAKDRKSAGSTAPPHGLYLQWIKYREVSEITKSDTEPAE